MGTRFYLSTFTAALLVGGFAIGTPAAGSSHPLPGPQERSGGELSAQDFSGPQKEEQLGFSRRIVVDTTDDELGIGGFVLNETFSVVGSNFYDAFYSAWTKPEGASLYRVYVREEPTPQFGARVVVEVGDTVIFRAFLRPNARQTQKAAQRAARRTLLYIREYHEPRDVY